MILILDNNEYRRHDVMLSLFIKKYLVAEHPLSEMDYYVKPFMTVYINPLTDELKKIKNEDTVTVVVKSNPPRNLPPWMHVIPNDKNVVKNIVRIYEEKCTLNKGREIFGIICIEGLYFTMGGAYIYMTKKQMDIIRLMLYNNKKTFNLYDISSYFKFNTDKEYGFYKAVRNINYKCRLADREPIILYKDDKYWINPAVLQN